VDECDSLMSQKDSRDDLKYLLKKTPEDKQIMMFSATLTPEVKKICLSLMKPETAVLEMEDN
jgi:ATP-dependent RNA helicase UAP56/SUB2